jgi:hypothetical protein
MVFPIVFTNAIKVRIVWQLNGADYAVNVLWLRNPGATAVNVALCDLLRSNLGAALTSAGMLPLMPTTVQLGRIFIQDISNNTNAEVQSTIATSHPGTSVSPVLPLQDALVATIRTAKVGKSFRGRIYTCGFATNAADPAGTATAATVAAVGALWSAYRTAINGLGVTHAVFSRPRPASIGPGGINVPAYGGALTDSTQIVVRDSRWDTIRKRAKPGI